MRGIVARCQCGDDCDCWIRDYVRRKEARSKQFPALHLVPDCGRQLSGSNLGGAKPEPPKPAA
jgi:hypothetical protein